MITLKTLRFLVLLSLMTLFIFSCNNNNPVIDAKLTLVATGFNFPEGPAWDRGGALYVSNCSGDWIAKIQNGLLDTLARASDTTFHKTNGLYVGKDGNIFACDFAIGAMLKISPSAKASIISSGYRDQPFHRPNDLVLDSNGNIYFTDPNKYSKDELDGRVFYFNMTLRELVLAADSLAFPNGVGISPIDAKLYVCESAKNQIIRFERIESGRLRNKEVFIVLPGGDPDGLDFDSKGNLYVAHFGSGNIFIISPNGKILKQIETPGKRPTNLEFGDSDLRTLYITEVETNALYKIRVKYPGYKSF